MTRQCPTFSEKVEKEQTSKQKVILSLEFTGRRNGVAEIIAKYHTVVTNFGVSIARQSRGFRKIIKMTFQVTFLAFFASFRK